MTSMKMKKIEHVHYTLNIKKIILLQYFNYSYTCTYTLGCIPLGWSGAGSVIQDLSGSWCIKETDESTLAMDSPDESLWCAMIHTDLGSLILNQFTPKEVLGAALAN